MDGWDSKLECTNYLVCGIPGIPYVRWGRDIRGVKSVR